MSKSSIKKGDRVLCYYPNAAVEPLIVTVLDVDSNAATESKLMFYVEVPGNGRCRLDSFWIDSIREVDRDAE